MLNKELGGRDMQEVFENIIEKLEESSVLRPNSKEFYNNPQNGEYVDNVVLFRDAIEIVKQEAEKFGTDTNVGSNGWIPVSERLPEEGGYYLVTYHGWSNGDYLPKFDDTYVRRLHYQKSERFTGWNHPRYCDDKAENDTNREVIAWQKLPRPYQTKGE